MTPSLGVLPLNPQRKKTPYYARKAALNAFQTHRRRWSPQASYHLARARYGADWLDRLTSATWLARRAIPLDGDKEGLIYGQRMI